MTFTGGKNSIDVISVVITKMKITCKYNKNVCVYRDIKITVCYKKEKKNNNNMQSPLWIFFLRLKKANVKYYESDLISEMTRHLY